MKGVNLRFVAAIREFLGEPTWVSRLRYCPRPAATFLLGDYKALQVEFYVSLVHCIPPNFPLSPEERVVCMTVID